MFVRAALSLYSLPARHLLLNSRRLLDLSVRWSATTSSIMGHRSFCHRLQSVVTWMANNEQPKDRLSLLFALRCLPVTIGCSLWLGLAGCGPAATDNAPNPGQRASVGGLPASKQGPPRNDLLTPAASPAPLTSGNETGAMSGKGTVPGGGSAQAGSAPSSKSVDPMRPLVVPEWMAKELDSPDVGTRLRALEKWVQTAPPGAIDPLILAYENKDERVRARAMELIEQDWAREADTEK